LIAKCGRLLVAGELIGFLWWSVCGADPDGARPARDLGHAHPRVQQPIAPFIYAVF